MDASAFFISNLNDSCTKLQKSFGLAIESSPCIILIYNLHNVLSNKTLHMLFISLLDHSTSRADIIVVATVLDASRVDVSLICDSRFTFTIDLSLLTASERRLLLQKRLRGVRCTYEALDAVALDTTEGSTCADIADMAEREVLAMFNRGRLATDQEIVAMLGVQMQIDGFHLCERQSARGGSHLDDLSFSELMGNHNQENEKGGSLK